MIRTVGAKTLNFLQQLGSTCLFLVQILAHSGTAFLRPRLSIRQLYFAGVLSKFPEAERGEMADAAGLVNVDCAFCSRIFPISLDEIAAHGSAA